LDVLLHLGLGGVALDHVLQGLVLGLTAVDESLLAQPGVSLDAVLQIFCNISTPFDRVKFIRL